MNRRLVVSLAVAASSAVALLTAMPGGASVPQALSLASSAGTQAAEIGTLTNYYVQHMSSLPGAKRGEGLWSSSDGCMRCDAGVFVAAASSYAASGNTADLKTALAGLDYDISTFAQPDGSIASPDVSRTGSPDLNTMFFADELGMAEIELGPAVLGPQRMLTWTKPIERAADFLVANGNLRWYTNGNIVVGNALTMALAWKLSGLPKYETDYQTALSFATSPPQNRWPGYGFITTKKPTKTDGSDGAGYFTETGAGGTGLDIDYTQLQAGQLSRLWIVTRDPQVLRLLNMTFNTLWPRVNTSNWTLDSSNGTRHTTSDRIIGFDTAALTVLARTGGRTDLAQYVMPQMSKLETDYRNPYSTSDGWMYEVGMTPASIVLADREQGAPGVAPLRRAVLRRAFVLVAREHRPATAK